MQLDQESERKLADLEQWTSQSQEEILKQAIAAFHHQYQPKEKTPLAIFEENGFIGCVSAEPERSENAKKEIYAVIEQRNDHR